MWSVCINRHSIQTPFTFADLSRLQDQVLASGQPTLLFAELAPTLTFGRRQDLTQFEALIAQGVDVVAGERGGFETWHGPGQWVGFVVCPIELLSGDARAVRGAIDKILQAVMPVVKEYEPRAVIEEGDRLGIWSPQGKLVSIGIRVRQGWVTSGFALNVIPHRESFLGIQPCGLKNVEPDFLFKNRLNPAHWDARFLELPLGIAAQFDLG